jgi:hypothetical protein
LQIGNCGIGQLKQIGSNWVQIGLEHIGSNPFHIGLNTLLFFCSLASNSGWSLSCNKDSMKLLIWVDPPMMLSVVKAPGQCVLVPPWEGSNQIGLSFVIQLRNGATPNVGGEPGGGECAWVVDGNRHLCGCLIGHGVGSTGKSAIFGLGS